jgi:hypothetical protein
MAIEFSSTAATNFPTAGHIFSPLMATNLQKANAFALRAILRSESHGGERQNPSKRLVMPVNVEHGRLVLVGARGDQEVWNRYATLAVCRELTLSGQRGRDRRRVDSN